MGGDTFVSPLSPLVSTTGTIVLLAVSGGVGLLLLIAPCIILCECNMYLINHVNMLLLHNFTCIVTKELHYA